MTGSHRNVVYVALGPLRVGAALHHTAALAAAGAQVTLVVADLPQWKAVALPPGVNPHRVPGPGRALHRNARRTVLGLLRDADLLVAGDPEALPVAWAAVGSKPGLAVRYEPADEPARRRTPAELAVVTPWYPSPNTPAGAGAVLRAMLQAVGGEFGRVSILHTESWTYPHRSRSTHLIAAAADRLAGRAGGAVLRDTPEGELTRVPVPVSAAPDYAALARAHVDALAAVLPSGRIEAPLVHAHTGIFGGLVAARLARPDARIVVTESAPLVTAVLARPAARRQYEEMLQRVDELLCPGPYVHQLVKERFPQYADKLRIVPELVDFDALVPRPTPVEEPLRWLHLGQPVEDEGVPPVLEAFARVAAEEPRVTLTLTGVGGDMVRTRVEELGLTGRVVLRAPVAADELPGLLHRHDVLVQPGDVGPLGATVVEAIASGLPVLVGRTPEATETLAGLDGVAGQFVDVGNDPEVVAAGWRRLRDQFGVLDLPAARARLLARHGRAAVAAGLLASYRPGPDATAGEALGSTPMPDEATGSAPAGVPVPATTLPAPAGLAGSVPAVRDAVGQDARLLVVAVNPPKIHLTREFVNQMTARGYTVDLVVNEPEQWSRARLDERVRLHPLMAAENRRLLLFTEQLLLFRLPGRTLLGAQQVARKIHRLGPEVAIGTLRRWHRRGAKGVHNRLFFPAYLVLRPLILWRITRRAVLPKLDLAKTRGVVVSGSYGTTIGWRLARRHPALPVTTSLTAFGDDS
ncbi:glycosyltransferase family 4 protein [Micromonospora sp. WMMD1102]|uniref:glycosyltransferase family 4 protein n=1 Tax=Micromonospora sp. WMMD1102 TaxID=3016105 RepID=UPI00241567D9|nr:glycosyltransferase family 4 protein [Micromonospora sp. WMMD1102]MDG4786336.1 glycosyltransferase family 4 protein [Micromonospora sp. WMMD1102]